LQQTDPQNKRGKGPVIDAIKLDRPGDCGPRPDFAYYVVKTCDAGDQRLAHRRRTRLRSGKVLDPCNAFLSECQIYDRSETGARIRLSGDRPVPSWIRLYEDWPERLLEAHVVWRKGREMGLCFNLSAEPRRISRTQLAFLRGRFYTARR